MSAIYAQHLNKEKDYQIPWCKNAGGISEYVLDDMSRVDCVTDEYAIEFDFASKWAEAVGQALYCASKTNRQPGIILIIEDAKKDTKYLNRLNILVEQYHIKLWVIDGLSP